MLDLLLTEGSSNKEMAASLGISVETVKRHLWNIMDKTGYSTRLELVVRTLQARQVPTRCACGLVREVYPTAYEKEIAATDRTPARYEVYDGQTDAQAGNRCIGRSSKSFAAAWRMAATLLAEASEC